MKIVANLSIKSRLYCGTLFCLAMLLVIGAAGFYALQQTRSTVEAVFATRVQTLTAISELRTSLGELQLAEKNIIANADYSDRAQEMFALWEGMRTSVEEATAHLLRQQPEDSDYAQKLGVTLTSLQRYGEDTLPVLEEVKRGMLSPAEGAEQVELVRSGIHDADALLRATVMQAQSELDAGRAQIATQASQMHQLIAAVLICAMLVMLPVTFFSVRAIMQSLQMARDMAQRVAAGDLSQDIIPMHRDEVGQLVQAMADMQASLRSLVNQVQEAASHVSSASGEIAGGNRYLSERTEGAATHLQATTAAMAELEHGLQHNAHASQLAQQQSHEACSVALQGKQVASNVVHTMAQIAQNSERITQITSVIDGIAFQTNILALNAAVEAARAGEQGRGFAVVANEVRALAARSADAAREIKALISDASSCVASGASLVKQAGSTMDAIVHSIEQVTQVVSEISSAASMQQLQIDKVLRAVNELEQMTQQNAALVEQSSAASVSLRDQAHTLELAIGQFSIAHVTLPAPQAPARLQIAA